MQRYWSEITIRTLVVLVATALLAFCLAGCGSGGSGMPNTGPLTVGNWGGKANSGNGGGVWPATLTVSASGGEMTIACEGPAQYSGTVILDSTGHFSVTGTSTPCCTPNHVPTRFDGSVQNNVMILTLTNTDNNATLGTYTLTFGKAAPAQNVTCPG